MPNVFAISSALMMPSSVSEHHDDEHVVVEGVLVAAGHAGPDRAGLSRARTATAKRREARVPRRLQRLVAVSHGREDQADRPEVGRLLNARFELIRHADHRGGAVGAGARRDHLRDVVPRHRAVLHLEPDEPVVLADLAIELRIERADRVAGDLLAAEEQFLRLVVERALVARADVATCSSSPSRASRPPSDRRPRRRSPDFPDRPSARPRGRRRADRRGPAAGRLAGVLSTTRRAVAARPACLYRDKRRAYEREDAERHHRAPHPHCRLLLPDDPIRFTHRRDVVYLIVFR